VGYAENKLSDTYRIFTNDKQSIVESRDVVWGDWRPREVRQMMPEIFGADEPVDDDYEVVDGQALMRTIGLRYHGWIYVKLPTTSDSDKDNMCSACEGIKCVTSHSKTKSNTITFPYSC
jgi:hypothetical protein